MSTSNLKISIAALSLCVSAVAIYIHLPYVIAAVSGSGAIEAVPLAIFAVSAIVALVSVICLIRLAVSRAGDKKKIDLSGEESGHTASQEPQKLVHENSTNLESELIGKEPNKTVKKDSESQIKVDSGTSLQDKSSVPTSPLQSLQTRDTAVPHVSQEKPVKQDSESQIKVDSGTSLQDKSSVSTSPSQPPQTHVTAVPQVPHSAAPPPPPPPSGAAGKKPPVIEVDSDTSLQDKSSVSTSPSQSPQTRDTAVPHVSQEKPVKQDSESQTDVDSGINLENKPIGEKPVKQDSESQTDVERVIPQNNNASSPSLSDIPPPPPPGGLKNWNPPKNNTTGKKSSIGTIQENALPAKKFTPPKDSNQVLPNLGDILKVRKNLKRPQPKDSICGQQGAGGSMDDSGKVLQNRQDSVKELDAVQSNKGTDKKETQKERKKQNEQGSEISPELSKKLKAKRRLAAGDEYSDDEHDSSANSPIVDSTSHNGETASETTPHGSQNTDQSHREVSDSAAQSTNVIANTLLSEVNHLYPQISNLQPDGERRNESPHSEYGSNEDWDTDPEPIEQVSSGSQSLHRERSWSLDSGHGSGSEPTSPLHPVLKAGKPPVPSKPSSFTEEANSSSPEPQTPPATTFDDTSIIDGKDPSTLPLKDRIAKFNKEASPCQRQFVARGSTTHFPSFSK